MWSTFPHTMAVAQMNDSIHMKYLLSAADFHTVSYANRFIYILYMKFLSCLDLVLYQYLGLNGSLIEITSLLKSLFKQINFCLFLKMNFASEFFIIILYVMLGK